MRTYGTRINGFRSVFPKVCCAIYFTFIIDIYYFILKRGRAEEDISLYILLVALWAKFSITAKSCDNLLPLLGPRCVTSFVKFKDLCHYKYNEFRKPVYNSIH
jgi:hypothetical protein